MESSKGLRIEKISIIGLGALGILYGEHFLRNMERSDVRIIADEERIARYKREGIYCNGVSCDFMYVTPDEEVEPADLLIFAVKYTSLAQAIKMVKGHVGPNTIIISVLNGIVSEAEIAQVYGSEHMLYTVAQGMTAAKNGSQMTYSNKGILCFGQLNAQTNSEQVTRVQHFLDQVALPYEINNQMLRKLWSKLLINVGINQTVGYYNGVNSLVQKEGEARSLMIGAMKEVIAVANKENVPLSEEDIQYWLRIIDTLNPEGKPSMAQDVYAGRPTEVDLFAGTIVALGRKHHVDVPINEMFSKYFSKLA